MTTLPPTARRPRAFTLVELIASIALVLILILGISRVFRIASAGVAGGQALSTAVRDNTSVQSVIYQDLKNAVMPPNSAGGNFDDGPCFIIRSERTYAFRNTQDFQGDIDTAALANPSNPTANTIRSRDLNGNNNDNDAGEAAYAASVNERSHRADRLIFFGRGNYPRQTGGLTSYVSPMSSQEAYVWYGHLQQPDFTRPLATVQKYEYRDVTAGGVTDPLSIVTGGNTLRNDENFYASKWILGRVVMTLREKDATGNIQDDNTVNQTFIDRPAYPTVPTVPSLNAYYGSLSPFSLNTMATDGQYAVQWSRYDLAATSISEYRDIIAGHYQRYSDGTFPAGTLPYWESLTQTRFHGNPIPQKPLTPAEVAITAPILLRGCTQFIVEFAGDFVKQDNDPASPTFGHVQPVGANPAVPDGVTDFVVEWNDVNDDGIIQPAENVGVRKVTRWYGFPRDVDGDNVARGWDVTRNPNANLLRDVVPLSDVVSSALGVAYVAPAGQAIEHIDRGTGTFKLPYPTNDTTKPAGNYIANTLGAVSQSRYYASWGPDTALAPKPRMLRMTLALDEPNGTMASDQTYEYVIDLP